MDIIHVDDFAPGDLKPFVKTGGAGSGGRRAPRKKAAAKTPRSEASEA